MKVIICGAGLVGSGIARQLAGESNAVTVIDQSPELVRSLSEELDIQGVVGHGAHPDILDQAGAHDAELLIAVTHSDEVNMVACHVAHSLFSVPTKIARIRAQSYLDPAWRDLFTHERMPIDVTISPELEVARSVLRRIGAPGAFEVIDFADSQVQVVGIRILPDCPVVDRPLRQLTELFPDLQAVVVAIVRDNHLFVPDANDHMQVNDDAYFVAATPNVPRTLDIFGHQASDIRHVVVVGAGHIGLHVAQQLEQRARGVKVRVIESNKARAEAAADALTRTVVLHGDGLDNQVMAEAGVGHAEALIALTNDDEANILSCVLAKQAGTRRVLSLINKRVYAPLTRTLAIDAFIDPRAITVSSIMQHVRRGRIKGLHSIEEGAAEVFDAEALATSPLVGKTLRDAPIPEGIIIGAILRQNAPIYPRGDTEIEAGDRVIMLARRDVVKKAEQLFRVSLDYF